MVDVSGIHDCKTYFSGRIRLEFEHDVLSVSSSSEQRANAGNVSTRISLRRPNYLYSIVLIKPNVRFYSPSDAAPKTNPYPSVYWVSVAKVCIWFYFILGCGECRQTRSSG